MSDTFFPVYRRLKTHTYKAIGKRRMQLQRSAISSFHKTLSLDPTKHANVFCKESEETTITETDCKLNSHCS